MAFAFLSDDWLKAAQEIRAEQPASAGPPAQSVRMNLVINEVPFGDGHLDAHLDTSGGSIDLDIGHLADPDLTVTVDYGTAKAILVDGNAAAGMQAFMAGKVRVDGDMAKLLALQGAPPDAAAADLAAKIRAITE
jgi:putative sterol carrier protein